MKNPTPVTEEELIEKATAPRVTEADLLANIETVTYLNAGRSAEAQGIPVPESLYLQTLCFLTLRNGFVVEGRSACASPENFDEEVGQKIAYQDAKRQVWALMGYALREKLHELQAKSEEVSGTNIKLVTNKLVLHPGTTETDEFFARVLHEANRAVSDMLIEGEGAVSWADASQWQKDSSIQGVRYLVENLDATPEQIHDNWCKDKVADGWIWGETKDADMKTHPCLVPYAELPKEQKVKDHLFRAIVLAMMGRI